ncbi:MAG: hypothetical protein KatS3mg105_1865 [Gemmatales bacterium]|nr:MAG: hypothetical protein KatS3mg105_1865 [Gemmatales bacterium]
MARAPLGSLLNFLYQWAGPTNVGEPSDSELLHRYREGKDESAFATLVRRHGTMVFRVARSVISDPETAEDVFQAAFLVLMQKASSIRKQKSIASWLYGVAYRIALNARMKTMRRRRHETLLAEVPEPAEQSATSHDPEPVLMEELNRLPDKYRTPLLLCYFNGKTNEETAKALGWPSGTVKGRLARARRVLRARLQKRGFALSSTALLAVLQGQSTVLSAELVRRTVQAIGACLLRTGSATLSPGAQALAHQAMRQIWLAKCRAVCLALAGIIAVAGGVAGVVGRTPTTEPTATLSQSAFLLRIKPLGELPPQLYQGIPTAVGLSRDRKSLFVLDRWHDGAQLLVQNLASGKTIDRISLDAGFRCAVANGRYVVVVYGRDDTKECKVRIHDPVSLKPVDEISYNPSRISPGQAFLAGDNLILVGTSLEGDIVPGFGGFGGGGVIGNGQLPFGDAHPVVVMQNLRQHANKASLVQPNLPTPPRGICFTGSHLAFSHPGEPKASLALLDCTSKSLRTLRAKLDDTPILMAANKHHAAIQLLDNRLIVWNLAEDKEQIALESNGMVRALALSPRFEHLAYASSDGHVHLWDLAAKKSIAQIKHLRSHQILFSEDGKVLVSSSPAGLKVWSISE